MPLLAPNLYEEDFIDGEKFKPVGVGRWWIRNALGNTVYIKKKTRQDAQEVVDSYYGKGRYKVCGS